MIESIGSQTFDLCKGLIDIFLSDSVKEIGIILFVIVEVWKKLFYRKV
jgi:hypothetical protein